MSRYDFALETSASIREARLKEWQKEKEKLAICDSFQCIEGKTEIYYEREFKSFSVNIRILKYLSKLHLWAREVFNVLKYRSYFWTSQIRC